MLTKLSTLVLVLLVLVFSAISFFFSGPAAVMIALCSLVSGIFWAWHTFKKQSTIRDHLTGLLTRDALENLLDSEIHKAARYQRPFTVASFSLDNPEKYHKLLGRTEYRALIQKIAGTLSQQIRKSDMAARTEEAVFTILFSESDNTGYQAMTGKIKQSLNNLLESLHYSWEWSLSSCTLTCSLASSDAHDLLQRMDQLLNDARQNGTNSTIFETLDGR